MHCYTWTLLNWACIAVDLLHAGASRKLAAGSPADTNVNVNIPGVLVSPGPQPPASPPPPPRYAPLGCAHTLQLQSLRSACPGYQPSADVCCKLSDSAQPSKPAHNPSPEDHHQRQRQPCRRRWGASAGCHAAGARAADGCQRECARGEQPGLSISFCKQRRLTLVIAAMLGRRGHVFCKMHHACWL